MCSYVQKSPGEPQEQCHADGKQTVGLVFGAEGSAPGIPSHQPTLRAQLLEDTHLGHVKTEPSLLFTGLLNYLGLPNAVRIFLQNSKIEELKFKAVP